MCQGSKPAETKSCTQLQHEYAILIKSQMTKQGVSVRCLVDEGIIKRSHRNRFYDRVAEGSLSYAEINKITERLGIDPVRAAITVQCFAHPESYEDPCCETSAHVATALAVHLTEEMAACEGTFEPLRQSLAHGLAKRATNEIARNHARLETQREAIAIAEASFG